MKSLVILILLSLITIHLNAQNVGINTINPQEQLHLRSDSTKIALRLDNKKNSQGGFNYNTTIGTPAQVTNAPHPIGFTPIVWTDLAHSKIINSDNNRMNGPFINIYPEFTSIRINFTVASAIPANAIITDIDINVECRRTSIQTGTSLLHLYLNTNANFNGVYSQHYISSNVDQSFSSSLYNNSSPFTITPTIINNGQYHLLINGFNLSNHLSRIEIDRISLDIEYKTPTTSIQNVSWTSGTKDGVFKISNSEDLNTKDFLTIDESGVTKLNALRIPKNAGLGKVLTSKFDGTAYWAEVPTQDFEILWINKEDTAFYANGPIQVNNNAPNAALIFNKGESRINNGVNMLETDNRLLNVIIDSNNDQENEQFNIYKDNSQFNNSEPTVRFHLDGDDSWINSGNFGIGLDNPNTSLHIMHGNDFTTEGLKLENSVSNTHWRLFSGSLGNLALFSTNSIGEIGWFSGVSGVYSSVSDRRRKKNISPVKHLLDRILQLEPVKYNFVQQKDTEAKTLGLIAQDVEPLFPEAVMYNEEHDTYTMDYSLFGVLAIQAIKEQQELINNLQVKIKKMEALELRINSLEKALSLSKVEIEKN